MSWIRAISLCAVLLLVPAVAWSKDISFNIQEGWTGFFGGKEETFHVSVKCPNGEMVRLRWGLSVGGRIVSRGEVAVNKESTGVITIALPQVKEAVVVDSVLSITALNVNGGGTMGSVEKTIRIFAEDPFAGRQEWLKELRIILFDPEQKTANALEQLKVPYRCVSNPEALADSEGGIVIVGEGVSFRDYPALADGLTRSASLGHSVLCLAPADGSFPIPGALNTDAVRPTRICFRSGDVIKDMDKKLDDTVWPPRGNLVARDLAVKSEQQLVKAEFMGEGSGWPWFEAAFPDGNELVLCGFAIMEHWESGPAPRYLLMRILEHLDSVKKRKEREA